MRRFKSVYACALATLFLFVATSLTYAQDGTIESKTADFAKYEGYFDFYWDEAKGKIWLEIDRWERENEFLYVNSLAAGVGSNDIGLDRGQLGSERVVFFKRVGPTVLLIQPNLDYRATSDNPLERRSVEEAFAQSVLHHFKVTVADGDKVLVDATDFLLRDAHGVSQSIRRSNQGNFSLNKARSVIYLDRTRNFPENSEFEAMLTFKGSGAGGWLRSVSPSSGEFTVRQHHSFVKLPPPGYKPRAYHPMSGFYELQYKLVHKFMTA